MSSSLLIRKGTSRSRDPLVAAAELHAALAQPDIELAVFYCASDYDLPALAAALDEQFRDINLIGCTSAGEITPQGYRVGAITGFSIASTELEAVTALIDLGSFDSVACATEVSTLLDTLEQRTGCPPRATNAFAFLLIDGLSMQEEIVVSRVHAPLMDIQLVGGSAADGTRFQATHLYHRRRFHRNAALLTLVHTRLPFIAFSTQHFTNSDKRMVVTRADPARRIVYEINAKPAAHEFAHIIGLETAELTPMIFATHPVVVRIGGQYFVRSIAKVNDDDSLSFFCAVDEGIVLTVARGVDMVGNLEQAFADVRAAIGSPQLVLGCDCVLRRLEAEREGITERIGRIFIENNVVGFSTYGEQFNSMHVNQTFTGIAIGHPRSRCEPLP